MPTANQRTAKRLQIRLLTCLLNAIGLTFVALAIVYFAHTAALPSWFPGHQRGSAHHHTKHDTAAVGLAIVSWIGAWFTTAPGNDPKPALTSGRVPSTKSIERRRSMFSAPGPPAVDATRCVSS